MRNDPRSKIIEVLRDYGELNITKIARLAGLNYRVASKYLHELVEQGVVEERRYGRLRLFRLKTR
ncbi:MAG: hypothetical protein B6U89_05065 [Desulfurococcales archaeon ex4484_58]|nr:MAG: hypothetical protein B6U89_05065 [Desulfurococcales archaeon ex4484_58]